MLFFLEEGYLLNTDDVSSVCNDWVYLKSGKSFKLSSKSKLKLNEIAKKNTENLLGYENEHSRNQR